MTDYPRIQFENTSSGLLKKRIWEASVEEIDKILEDYGLPGRVRTGQGRHLHPEHAAPHRNGEAP